MPKTRIIGAIERIGPFSFPAWPRLEWNGIRLLPKTTQLNRDGVCRVVRDRWCLPGGRVVTTAEATVIARKRNATLKLLSPVVSVLTMQGETYGR